ncbi:hypothetical protein F511_19308 [Dorcoceras hygrometricum]|uniref:Uncharacterized protein n=1 Tax=Dorcoceras hygrometricum TaxID=472368 RepID=A0A2Z7ARG0_9LAMI|nr:hypothetical protein F511_19308 [Dorcoceras hygrometricum]
MSLFDLQDVCIAIGSLATLDLPMVVDLIGIYVLKGPYCTLTMTNWFLQALSLIPRGSWRDVARRFTMIRWARSHKYWIHDSCMETELNALSIGGGFYGARIPIVDGRSSVFNILDRHCPPSLDVLPLNLAQKSQNFKIDQNGPDIEYWPENSRAARDRPEQNPRRIQPSRHPRSFTGCRPLAAAATHEIRARQPRNVAPSAKHGRAQHRAKREARPRATSARRPAIERRNSLRVWRPIIVLFQAHGRAPLSAPTQQLARPARGAADDRSRNRCTTQASAAQHRCAAIARWGAAMRGGATAIDKEFLIRFQN